MIRCSHSFFVFGSRRIQHETFTLVVFLHFCWIVFRSTIGFQGSFGQYQNSLRHERGKVSNLEIDLFLNFKTLPLCRLNHSMVGKWFRQQQARNNFYEKSAKREEPEKSRLQKLHSRRPYFRIYSK